MPAILAGCWPQRAHRLRRPLQDRSPLDRHATSHKRGRRARRARRAILLHFRDGFDFAVHRMGTGRTLAANRRADAELPADESCATGFTNQGPRDVPS